MNYEIQISKCRKRIKNRIKKKYGNIKKFAKAMEMNPVVCYMKINGKLWWGTRDIFRACHLLNIKSGDSCSYFHDNHTELWLSGRPDLIPVKTKKDLSIEHFVEFGY